MAVYSGEGIIFKVDGTALTQVTKVEFGSIEQAGVDDFHLGSTSKTQRPGLPDYGTCKVSFFFDEGDAKQMSLMTKASDKSSVTCVIQFLTGGTITITGFVTSFDIGSAEVDNNVESTCEIKVNSRAYAD